MVPWVLASLKPGLLTEKQGKVTFEDVAGVDEAKDELEEVIEFLKSSKISKIGEQILKVYC